jgi:hypothetical protein
MIITLISYNSYSESTFEFSADKIFNFKNSLDLKYLNSEKKPIIQTVQSNEEIKAFTLNYNAFESMVHSEYTNFIINNFPVTPLKNDVIEIKRTNSIVDADTKFYRGTKNGKVLVKAPEINTFIGKIRGQENSRVLLTYSNGDIYGFIEDKFGYKYSISSTSTVNSKYDRPHILTSHESQVPANVTENPFNCLTPDYTGDRREVTDRMEDSKHDAVQQTSKLLNVPLLLEGAYDFYRLMGSNYDKSAVYMIAVIAHTAKIYEEYLNCTFTLVSLLIWDNENDDPYYSTTKNLEEKLQKMPENWQSDGTPRALVTLFANLYNQPANTVIAGISMGGDPEVGSLCNNGRGYNVLGVHGNYKYPTMNYTWDVQVAGHEIGHNFSAPHTHNCYFAPNMIDTCVTKNASVAQAPDACLNGTPIPRLGTLMSYCHLGNPTNSVAFLIHPRQVNMMRKAAEKSNCVNEPVAPKVRLLTFLGDKTYIVGASEDIRWTTSKVSNVKIQYSIDNGKNWNVIVPTITAADTIYKWTVPNVATTSALMMVLDASNSAVSDTSKTVFTIASTSINVTKPQAGEKYAIKENVYVAWTASLIDAFNVSYSSNNGTTWTSLATNLKSTSFTWSDHPNAGKYIFKVSNAADANFSVTSGEIELGNPVINLIKPNGGEQFCWNQTNEIVWENNFINNVYLQFSIDKGATWKNVLMGQIDANDKKYSWKPAQSSKTTQALVRICAGYDKAIILDSSAAVFNIDSCIVGVDDFQILSGITINELVPNPVINNATLKISNGNDINLTAKIELVNEIGTLVKEINSIILPASSNNEIKINVEELAIGNYFILIKTEKGNLSYPIRIYR